MKYFFLTAISLLSILGFADIVRAVVFWLLKLPDEGMYIVTHIKNADEAEHTVRSVLEKIRWCKLPAQIVFVYNDDDMETKHIAEKIIYNNPQIGLFSRSDLHYNSIIND